VQVKLSESVLSMPAELAGREGGLRIQPNRERIRQILATTSLLELQRQLLTTVMENEVSWALGLYEGVGKKQTERRFYNVA
jgi:hypothetical protein